MHPYFFDLTATLTLLGASTSCRVGTNSFSMPSMFPAISLRGNAIGDGTLDPNLARYREKERSRSITPPGSPDPWPDPEEAEPEPAAAGNTVANNTEDSDANGWTEVVRGNKKGAQWPKPVESNLSTKF